MVQAQHNALSFKVFHRSVREKISHEAAAPKVPNTTCKDHNATAAGGGGRRKKMWKGGVFFFFFFFFGGGGGGGGGRRRKDTGLLVYIYIQ